MGWFGQPMRVLIFNVLLIAICGYASWRGGGPERFVAALYLVAAVTTRTAWLAGTSRYANVEWGLFAIDFLMLLALTALALKADRFWITPAASLQLIMVGIHISKMVYPGFLGWAYAVTSNFLSYPMLLLLAVGTWRHQRRSKTSGADPSWSN